MDKMIITNSYLETIELGNRLAKLLPSGSVILLKGDLGAGKTTLVRGIAKGLNVKDVVQSPTFNIMKIYLKGDRPLIHIDAYRLLDSNADIGLDEYIGYESGLTLIEWPDYINTLLPPHCLEIEIKHDKDDVRILSFKNFNDDILEAII